MMPGAAEVPGSVGVVFVVAEREKRVGGTVDSDGALSRVCSRSAMLLTLWGLLTGRRPLTSTSALLRFHRQNIPVSLLQLALPWGMAKQVERW